MSLPKPGRGGGWSWGKCLVFLLEAAPLAVTLPRGHSEYWRGRAGCRCEPAGFRAITQQTSPEGKITEEKKNINNAKPGHNRRSSLKYLKLGELKVVSLHHDILSKVIIINLLLIQNNSLRKYNTSHTSPANT